MARSHKNDRTPSVRHCYGKEFTFRPQPRMSGLPRDYWQCTDDGNVTVRVCPPSEPGTANRWWLVIVDDMELLDLSGPFAEKLAFAAASAFAHQNVAPADILKELEYQKALSRTRRRRLAKRSRRHHR